MASEIMSEPPPMLKSDMPESSMARELQGTIRNQSSSIHFLERIFTQILQELRKEDTPETPILPQFSLEDVKRFQDCLSSGNCAQLLKMVEDKHAKLFLETFDKKNLRSALHVAVLEGSQTLICSLFKKLKALPNGNNSKWADHDFILKEGAFGLSAIHMASLIANKEIISCLSEQGLQFFDYLQYENSFCQSPTSEDEKQDLFKKASPLLDKRAPSSSDEGTGQLSLRKWLHKNDVDFVYCLHEAAMNSLPSQKKALEFVEHVCDNEDVSFLEPLLKVQDSLGRTPLHVHDNHDCLPLFKKLATNFSTDWNMRDFGGRTPLHWAAAQGNVDLVNFLAERKIDLNAIYGNIYGKTMKTSTNFNYGGFWNVTPLHLAVIHNHVEVVEALLKVKEKQGLDVNAVCWRKIRLSKSPPEDKAWTPIQLAAYLGHRQIVRKFLKDDRTYDPGLKNGNKTVPKDHNMISALHLAASQFQPLTVKTLVDSREVDTLIKDNEGNGALHHATKHAHGQPRVYANLYDYVTVSHFTSNLPKPREPSEDDITTCMDILMQSGLRMDSKNEKGKIPILNKSCPRTVRTWWLGKMAQEYQEIKNNLITAANAVSVTAALVATASFVGPLQPPLGLLDDGNQTWLDGYSQVKHTSVQVFLFCDNFSFYLAIAAIVFAMLPSWPLPHEGLVQEVFIARKCVQGSVLLLFGSIIFVICAFSAASISIVPDQRWRYMTNAVISTSLGILICFIILFLSFTRLLALFPSNNEVAKKISDVATRILIWEPKTSRTNKEVTKSTE